MREDLSFSSAPAFRLASDGALRVLLVDDHGVVCQGLAAFLREAPGIELIGEAPDPGADFEA